MAIQKLHLFIDTSAFLSFFAYTKDDVEELKKLASLIKTGQVGLYLTEQVRDEFYRNREKKLSESISQFEKSVISTGIPRFMVEYPQVADYTKAAKKALKAKDEAVQRAKKEAEKGKLAADVLFRQIVKVAHIRKIKQEDYTAATRRMQRGNPPGKEDSLGDRINWEILLRAVPAENDLQLVSKDGDYASPLNPTAPNAFLLDEWQKRKKAELVLHAELKPFLAQHFPKIKFAVDVEKRAAIDGLKQSRNFASTHAAIAELAPFVDALTPDEIDELIDAAEINSQISWICRDPDIKRFYEPLLESQHDNRRLSKAEYKSLRIGFGLDPPKSQSASVE
jgi:predicted nucleic acid-binding protein